MRLPRLGVLHLTARRELAADSAVHVSAFGSSEVHLFAAQLILSRRTRKLLQKKGILE